MTVFLPSGFAARKPLKSQLLVMTAMMRRRMQETYLVMTAMMRRRMLETLRKSDRPRLAQWAKTLISFIQRIINCNVFCKQYENLFFKFKLLVQFAFYC